MTPTTTATPARVRRTLSDRRHSLGRIREWLRELRSATIEIESPRLPAEDRLLGGLIDHVEPSPMTRHNPLSGGERHLWRVRLGKPLVELMKRDLLLWYDPAPLARLRYGISQAVARHVLTHNQPPDKGWKLDGLIKVVCGVLGSQAMRDARRRIRKDGEGLSAAGVVLDGERVGVAHRPGAWHSDPMRTGISDISVAVRRAPPGRWAGQVLSLSQENLQRGGHMRGSSKWQVQEVYKVSGIDRIGQPRHAAKEEAWAAGARTSSEVAQKTGIHSFRTKEAYLKVWRQCLDHAKSTFRVGDIEKLTGEHVSSFLRSRIDEDVGRQTYGQAASALGKLEDALHSYAEAKGTGLSYDFRSAIRQVSPEAKGLASMVPGRAFRDPNRVISLLPYPDFRLAAAIQHDAGLRMSEATHVRPDQLKGEGKIEVRGKGGKIRVAELSRHTYQQLVARMKQSGEFQVSRDAYRSAVVRASEAANDKGSPHSFRHRWAQDRLQEKLSEGKTWERALSEVSREIGHERAEITKHYQGRR